MAGPSQRVLLEELKELRRHRGASLLKVRNGATALMNLPVVDDQMQFANSDDRDVCAYSVLRCAVERFPEESIPYRILTYSLNFDWLIPLVLTDRMSSLSIDLPASRNTLEGMVTSVYEDLAAFLITSRKSPCRARRPSQAERIRITIDGPKEDLTHLLRELVRTERSHERQGLSVQISDLLPRAWTASVQAGVRYRYDIGTEIITRRHEAHWQAQVDWASEVRGLMLAPWESMLYFRELYFQDEVRGDRELEARLGSETPSSDSIAKFAESARTIFADTMATVLLLTEQWDQLHPGTWARILKEYRVITN